MSSAEGSLPAGARGGVTSRLARVLAMRGISWAELARRTLLSPATIGRLRRADADPPLPVAERVAAALDLPIERLWQLRVDGRDRAASPRRP